ncbi:MAG: LamG domain-containing protein [Akkermansiaceae bacterium]|nr:LamG domain-containing protein [Akkermansiaceae bacterium]
MKFSKQSTFKTPLKDLKLTGSRSAAAIVAGIVCLSLNPASAATTAYRNLILGDNPIVYYEFDETSGTTAANSAITGATYTGTFNTTGGSVTVGQASFAQGGTAFDFGGGFIGSASALTSSLTEWTVEAWVNYDSAKTSASNFLSSDQGGWNDDILIGIGAEGGSQGVPGGSVGLIHQGNPGTTRDAVASSLAANEWHHVVMTGSTTAGALTLYVDGALVDSNTSLTNGITFNGTGGFGAAPNLTIGAARPNSGDAGYRPYDGLLDEVAIYDSVLTPAQINAHATNSIPEPGSALLLSLGGLVLLRRNRR